MRRELHGRLPAVQHHDRPPNSRRLPRPRRARDTAGELNRAAGAAATVSGRGAGSAVEALVRRTTRVAVSLETRADIRRRLMERKGELERHFGVALGACEEPQFLRYEEGDFFVAHQDGNTPMIHDDTRHRKISVIAFLSPRSEQPAPGGYGGGSLVFHGSFPDLDLRVPVLAAPGTLVAFARRRPTRCCRLRTGCATRSSPGFAEPCGLGLR